MTYLTIITTVLVLTQVIRLIQNSLQLKQYKRMNGENAYIMSVYAKIEKWVDKEREDE